MRKKTIIFILVSFAIFAAISGLAPGGDDIPSFQGYVNDFAVVFSEDAKSGMEALASLIERKTTAEMAIVTVKTTSGTPIEDYAVRLFKKWGIGKIEKNNGLLIVMAIDDRAVRVEVGYGLEGAITDIESKNIIEKVMIPYFKKGDYDAGAFSSLLIFAKMIAKEYNVDLNIEEELKNIPGEYLDETRPSPLSLLFTFLIFMLIFGTRFGPLFFLMSYSGRRGGYWYGGSGGSFGGGFGGFGGGFSGGGGASGRW